VQSSVAYGHVGNSAATFPLMRMGVEVWPVLTVHFSNHTGYGSWRGPLLSAHDVAEVVTGIEQRGVLAGCDAVLSGYQGAEDVGAVVLDAVTRVQAQNPDAIYCCDPVMGDVDRGFFVRPEIPPFLRDQMVPRAHIITPNQFELEYLTGTRTRSLAEVLAAARSARDLGPEVVLTTSVLHEGTEPGTIDLAAVSGQGAWSVTTPRFDRTFNGAGDLTAALFLAHYLRTRDVPASLAATASAVYGVLAATAAGGQRELQLVAAQDELVAPTRTFTATRLD
jgi:pyridoxine kinase